MTAQPELQPRRDSLALVAGVILLVVSAGLYTSDLSRAISLWILPLAIVVTAMGAATLAGLQVPRWAGRGVVVAALVLAGIGLSGLIYALAHQPVTV